jgi:AcrR family transcriptional regulator
MSKGQSTKQMIIEKSADLFNMRGYAGCSLSDIMTATGLKKGGIYNHFSNKDEIAEEAFKYSMDLLEAKLAAVTASMETDKDRLSAILEFYRNYATKPIVVGGCPILNTIVDADGTNPKLISLARQKTERLLKQLEFIVARGQEQGEFKTDIEPRSVSLTIFSGLEGAILLTKAFTDAQAITAMINCLVLYLENTLYLDTLKHTEIRTD